MLLGLIGYPLSHSLSPLMHNRAFEALDIQAQYCLFSVKEEDLRDTVYGLKTIGSLGFNVTIPYKQKVISFLDEITPQAAEIGAVNLVYRKGERFIGDNSDAPGFIRALKEADQDPQGKRSLIVGSGGAARAVAVGLRDSGSEVIVTSRQKPKAKFWEQFPWLQLKKDLSMSVDLVVDCTPVGMYPDNSAQPVIDPRLFKKETVFCDLVYNPLRTSLIKVAEATGHQVVTGDGMLLYQGAISFEKWFLQKAPVNVMQEALSEYLEGGKKND